MSRENDLPAGAGVFVVGPILGMIGWLLICLAAGALHGCAALPPARNHSAPPGIRLRALCLIKDVRFTLASQSDVIALCNPADSIGFSVTDDGRLLRANERRTGCFHPRVEAGPLGLEISGHLIAPMPTPTPRWWNFWTRRSPPILWDEVEHLIWNACQEISDERA